MKDASLSLDSIEAINEEIQKTTSKYKTQLLKHYLIYYILYLNLPSDDREDSPIKEKLLKIAIVLEKINSMKKKAIECSVKNENEAIESGKKKDGVRMAETWMLKQKGGPSVNPRKKFRKNSDKQKERSKKKPNYNI